MKNDTKSDLCVSAAAAHVTKPSAKFVPSLAIFWKSAKVGEFCVCLCVLFVFEIVHARLGQSWLVSLICEWETDKWRSKIAAVCVIVGRELWCEAKTFNKSKCDLMTGIKYKLHKFYMWFGSRRNFFYCIKISL